LPYPDDFALSEQRNEIFITFVVIFQAAEPTISAAKKMIKKDNIESKVFIGKSGDLLLRRRKQELPPSGM